MVMMIDECALSLFVYAYAR